MTASTKRSVKSAKQRRKALIDAMGGACAKCGKTVGKTNSKRFHFHHVADRDWVAVEMSRWMRIKFYERDYFQCILVLLCKSCHYGVVDSD